MPALLVTYACIIFIMWSSLGSGSTTTGISKNIGLPIALLVGSLASSLFIWGFTGYSKARAIYYEDRERAARGEVDRAIDDITGPDDLLGLIRANRKQMDAYDSLARSQAETSYRASLVAMTAGLVLIATGVAVAIFADSTSTKYAAAIVTAVGAATGGYISRTFLTVQRGATEQMNYYFQQPLVQSYLLSAERLVGLMPTESRGSQLELVLKAALMQAAPTQELKGQHPLPPTEKTGLLRTRSHPKADGS